MTGPQGVRELLEEFGVTIAQARPRLREQKREGKEAREPQPEAHVPYSPSAYGGISGKEQEKESPDQNGGGLSEPPVPDHPSKEKPQKAREY